MALLDSKDMALVGCVDGMAVILLGISHHDPDFHPASSNRESSGDCSLKSQITVAHTITSR